MELLLQLAVVWMALGVVMHRSYALWQYVPVLRHELIVARVHGTSSMSPPVRFRSALVRSGSPALPWQFFMLISGAAVVIGALWGALMPL